MRELSNNYFFQKQQSKANSEQRTAHGKKTDALHFILLCEYFESYYLAEKSICLSVYLSLFIAPKLTFHVARASQFFSKQKTWIYELSLSQISMHDLRMLKRAVYFKNSVDQFFSFSHFQHWVSKTGQMHVHLCIEKQKTGQHAFIQQNTWKLETKSKPSNYLECFVFGMNLIAFYDDSWSFLIRSNERQMCAFW